MAAFGARYIMFAPFETEPDESLPTYGPAVNLGALVKAELTVNLATGEIYGDDKLDEKIEEFVSGSLSVETTDLAPEKEAVIFGSTVDEAGNLVDNTDDEIPYGGLGYIKTVLRGGAKIFKAQFHPKVKAAMGTDSANTKSSSITLAATPYTFTVYEPNTGDWRYRQEFKTEAEAKAWINKMLGAESDSADEPET